MKRTIASTLLVALAVCAGLVQAAPRGEVVVYGQQGFHGKRLVLKNDIANFEGIGFNDRASSLRVVHGTWEFCTDAFYRGSCRVLGPGEYPDL
ncbi:MAG TPA: beta/gamma crystallin-related protein, partial [Usitatibacter sp.]|nr:beta/gamma crystallin-related protein [Usitatibacter sp.]